MEDTGIVTTAVIPADSGADKPIYDSNNYHHNYVNWLELLLPSVLVSHGVHVQEHIDAVINEKDITLHVLLTVHNVPSTMLLKIKG